MKTAKIVFIALAILIGGILAFAATRPDTFRVERSVTINAAAEKIFPYVNDFRNGTKWSPWEKTDAQMKRTYSGKASGAGAVYEWAGNKEAGKGRMQIVESVPSERVVVQMHFYEPMEGENKVEYLLSNVNNATKVTWIIYGPMPFASKVMCLFFDMDKMIGGQFEKGLQQLKILMEK